MAYSIDRMPERISIGRETETGVTDVMIDCGAWFRKWPGMTLHAIHTPEGGAPYILQTETDGGVLVWHVTDADTATPGTGLVEIVGETDGRRKVSAMVKVSVAARMAGTVGEPPEAAQPWADRVVEAAGRITGMKVQAETLASGSVATAEWDGEQGLLTIGVPKGEQGQKGEKGEKGDTGDKGDKGDTGAQGEKGAPGAPGKDAVVDATLTQSGQAADAKTAGDALACKLTEPSEGLAVGRYFRIASMDDTGHAVLEAVDAAQVGVQDVKVAGESIVAAGVANVPNATNNAKGVIRGNTSIVDSNFAVSGGSPYCMTRNASDFYSQGPSGFVSNGTLRNVLTAPSLMPSLTAEEQTAARERMGIYNYNEIAVIALAEDSTPIIDLGAEYEKLFIVFEIPAGDTCIGGNYIRNQNGRSIGFFPTNSIFTSSARFATAIISRYGNYWACDSNYCGNNSAASLGSNRSAYKNDNAIITQLNFSNPIRTGSKISVYGVRVS